MPSPTTRSLRLCSTIALTALVGSAVVAGGGASPAAFAHTGDTVSGKALHQDEGIWSGWTNWDPDGRLQFRVKRDHFNKYSKPHGLWHWLVEFKSNYSEEMFVQWQLAASEGQEKKFGNAHDFKPGEVYQTWGLVDNREKVWVRLKATPKNQPKRASNGASSPSNPGVTEVTFKGNGGAPIDPAERKAAERRAEQREAQQLKDQRKALEEKKAEAERKYEEARKERQQQEAEAAEEARRREDDRQRQEAERKRQEAEFLARKEAELKRITDQEAERQRQAAAQARREKLVDEEAKQKVASIYQEGSRKQKEIEARFEALREGEKDKIIRRLRDDQQSAERDAENEDEAAAVHEATAKQFQAKAATSDAGGKLLATLAAADYSAKADRARKHAREHRARAQKCESTIEARKQQLEEEQEAEQERARAEAQRLALEAAKTSVAPISPPSPEKRPDSGKNADFITQVARLGSSWEVIPGAATDIGVGLEGSLWVLGTGTVSGGYRLHLWKGQSSWAGYEGGAVRISVAPEGLPWVINEAHQIFQMDKSGSWTLLPGRATDIGVGAGGSVWVVGLQGDASDGGKPIFRWSGSEWVAIKGSAERISVDAKGVAWIINKDHRVFRYNSSTPDNPWESVGSESLKDVHPADIAVGANGTVWIVAPKESTGGGGVFYWDETAKTWCRTEGSASHVAVGADGQPFVVNSDAVIFRMTLK